MLYIQTTPINNGARENIHHSRTSYGVTSGSWDKFF